MFRFENILIIPDALCSYVNILRLTDFVVMLLQYKYEKVSYPNECFMVSWDVDGDHIWRSVWRWRLTIFSLYSSRRSFDM